MKTFTATITWPEEKIKEFAERRGFSEMVPNPKRQNINQETGEVTTNENEPELITNPDHTVESFMAAIFTDYAVQFFMTDADSEIERVINEQSTASRAAMRGPVQEQIKSAIAVTWS